MSGKLGHPVQAYICTYMCLDFEIPTAARSLFNFRHRDAVRSFACLFQEKETRVIKTSIYNVRVLTYYLRYVFDSNTFLRNSSWQGKQILQFDSFFFFLS